MPRPVPPSSVDYLEAEREYRGWNGQVRRLHGARVVTNPRYRRLLPANQILVGATEPPVEWDAIERAATPSLRNLGIRGRRVTLFGEEVRDRLGPALARHGYRPHQQDLLAFGGISRVTAATDIEIRTVDPLLQAACYALNYRIEEERHGPGPEGTDRASLYQTRADSAWRRTFAGFLGTALGGACDLTRIGSLAQISHVGTAPEWRGRGVASALVLHAIGAALETGARGIYLITDSRTLTERLYGPLGFHPAGRITVFERPPAPDD